MPRRYVYSQPKIRGVLAGVLALLTFSGQGCLERTMLIESDPPGAAVTLNDVEVGRTPLETDFTYYGTYDVLLTKDGYEPLRLTKSAATPIWEYAPIDLAATAIPVTIRHTVPWKFKLQPSLERTLPPDELAKTTIQRARALRDQLPSQP